ncbi:hypothetical protein [Jhaorihella thermophila]|uniref:hypothetical protein n=1 Tax=Jhaorihella thermophila TaxID=488547 RepID=UPI0036203DE0
MECVFGPPLKDLYDRDQRIDNFLSYCLPLLPTIFHDNRDLLTLKTREITDLLQAILSRREGGGDQGGDFLLFGYLLSQFAPAPPEALEDTRKTLQEEFSGLSGSDLVARLTEVLARQSQQVERLAATVRLLDAFEQQRDILLQAEGPVAGKAWPLARSAEIRATDYLPPAAGFHALQFTAGGTPYRWCGPEGTLQFAVHVDRTQGARLRLEMRFAVEPENFRHVELLDGRQPVPVEIAASGESRAVVTATLPPREDEGGTYLTFRFPRVRRLSETDERLAVGAFVRLTVTALDQEAGVQ